MPTPSKRSRSTRDRVQCIKNSTSLLLILLLSGCAADQTTPRSGSSRPNRPIVAMIDGHPITSDDLWAMLGEAAGGQVLDEYILTTLLESEVTRRGWTISDSQLQHELDALVTTIDQTADPKNTPRLIDSIRARRGLGPVRFEALLRRNAILRKMSANTPAVAARIQSEVQLAVSKRSTPPTDAQLAMITHRATLVAQQTAMEELAQSLVDRAEVLVMDRSIGWSRRAGD